MPWFMTMFNLPQLPWKMFHIHMCMHGAFFDDHFSRALISSVVSVIIGAWHEDMHNGSIILLFCWTDLSVHCPATTDIVKRYRVRQVIYRTSVEKANFISTARSPAVIRKKEPGERGGDGASCLNQRYTRDH